MDELDISDESKCLLKKLLEKDVEKRISPSEALMEEFFQKNIERKNLNSTYGEIEIGDEEDGNE